LELDDLEPILGFLQSRYPNGVIANKTETFEKGRELA
jgi:hypothetical protein